ncbi:MAG: hypothetical protein KDE69_13205 [Burkholderiaceae bacterium]|nr:hypothetical protein [Burkholderiaceae bacterium]
MAASRVSADWRMDWGFPLLGRIPTSLPWRLAHRLGRDPAPQRQATERYLEARFREVFPDAEAVPCRLWAQSHMEMLAQEMLDSVVLYRMGMPGGPRVTVSGWEHVEALQSKKQGFIVVLNHYDRLLAGPIALARRGLRLHAMTMPIAENAELNPSQRRFLTNKIKAYTDITGGQWCTSNDGLRPLHEGLRSGQAWGILADAWRPEFGRLRSHPFLGGQLQLPTGIERLAHSTGAALLHVITRSQAPDQLNVQVEPLPADPRVAIDQVIQRLEADVRERPWAWWHWGLWDQMWRPAPQEERHVQY